jgi:Concanavalin A-like lectin/glucanases superfamily
MSFTRADYPPLSTISYISTLTSVTFVPTNITGCTFWVDGSDPLGTGTPPADGTSLSTWYDKSGSAYNAVAYSAATVKTNIQNSKSIVRFSSNSYNVTYPSFPYSAYTFFTVMYLSVNNGYSRLINGSYGDSYLFIGTNGTSVATFNGNGGWNDVNANSPTINNYQAWCIVAVTVGSSVLTPYVNGTAQNTHTGTTAAFSNFTIGSFTNAPTSQSYSGDIGDLIVYNSVLTTTQRQQVEGYLAWKWGLQANLPGGHPYASTNPNGGYSSTLTSTINLNLTGYTQSTSRVINSTAFVPTSITGCQLWMDGADSTTITTATGVSQWNDKSGNAYNFTQATTGSQPTRTGNYLNFQSNYYLTIPTAFMNNYSTWTLFFLINPISSSNWIMVKQHDGVTTENVLSMTLNTGSGGGGQSGSTGYLYWRSYNAGTQAVSSSALTTSAVQIFSIVYDGTNLYMYINGTLNSTTAGSFAAQNDTTPTAYTLGGWYVSGSLQNSSTTNFQLGEMISYSTSLSTAQRQNVEGYLAWKWGLQASLSAGHPYLSTNPNLTTSTVTTIYAPKTQVPLAINPYYTGFNFATLSTLALWIDGSDPLGTGVAPAQGTLLSSLIDKSGNNRAISTFSTTVGYPIYKTAANGNLGAIQLGAGNGIFLSSIALTPMMSLYAVYSPINPSTGIAIEQGANALSTAGFLLTSVSTTSTVYTIGSFSGVSATGGTVTTAGNFKYHLFTASGTFILGSTATINYLIVGGGGGGGDRHGGGGGAGGVLGGTWNGTPGSYTITVGAGGVHGATNEGGQTAYGNPSGAGSKGGDSSISSVATAYGGGGGGTLAGNPTDTLIGSGGGGGGGGLAGIAGTAGQGYSGGSGNNPGGGGGGGAGGAGVNADTATGGVGTSAYSTQLLAVGYGTSFATSWVLGTATYQTAPSSYLQSPIVGGVAYIAGGGGGNGGGTSPGGAGGSGGGGRGDYDDTYITGGTTNTGGGGGSSRSASTATVGRDGGSGLVLLWYPLTITPTATGGTITTSGLYKIHTFTTTGANTFTLTSPASITAQVLVVGGGGAGGSAYVGGGGGAGGAVFNASFTITSGTYTVTVGAGGARTTAGVGYVGPSGSNSSFSSITGTGGGGGGSYLSIAATNGGCGGGGPFNSGQFGTGSQGGNGAPYGTDGVGGYNCGGGGGGMGGTAPTPSGVRPSGGAGATYTVAGTAYTLAGGGGAGSDGQGGLGQAGGGLGGNGNNAGQSASSGGDATANTGSGGGGGGGNNGSLYGGAGGSGIVIIAYLA